MHKIEYLGCFKVIDIFQYLFKGDNGVLIYPSHPTPAPYHGLPLLRPFNAGYTAIFNVLGNPVTQVNIINTQKIEKKMKQGLRLCDNVLI